MEQIPCIRCARVIDANSKSCPFCNWNQQKPYVAENQPVVQLVAPRSEDRSWKKYLLIGGGVVAVLIGAFFLGAAINRDGAPAVSSESKLAQAEAPKPVAPAKRANTIFEPVGSNTAPDQPITTAPAAATPDGASDSSARTDATAVAAAEYSQLAARAQAERRAAALVDPRSITGTAYSGGVPVSSAPAPRQRTLAARRLPTAASGSAPTRVTALPGISSRTRPIPEYQPLPSIHTAGDATARLELTVGADGRVKEVSVLQGIPGETPRIIAAVQSWRFKPATENGNPVSAPFSVDISFNGRD